MPAIVLVAVNARYSHASFGARYLLANLGGLRDQAALLERDLRTDPDDLVRDILALRPAIAAFGVYIWNRPLLETVLPRLRRDAPDLRIVLGGPELTAADPCDPLVRGADAVLIGEADLAFAETCRLLLAGDTPPDKIRAAPPPPAESLTLPYDLYTDEDIAHRVIYVEASRGCPYRCEFCLSSLDRHLHRFPLDRLLPAFDTLIRRGVREFKFTDRTFNLDIDYACALLDFFLDRPEPDLFVHVEMVPDRLPDPLRDRLRRFAPGALQLEVGIQTWNPGVAARIGRRHNPDTLETNLRWLLAHTGAHLHADLIVGLPGETFDSIAAGFDRLADIGPQEIQVNLLKLLPGVPLHRHIEPWAMRFDSRPPYELRESATLDAPTVDRLRRFARAWDLTVNRGNFRETARRLAATRPSPFAAGMAWADWLHQRLGRMHGIPLDTLTVELFEYLTGPCGRPAEEIAEALYRDARAAGRPDLPVPLRPHVSGYRRNPAAAAAPRRLKRQHRHRRPDRTGPPDPATNRTPGDATSGADAPAGPDQDPSGSTSR